MSVTATETLKRVCTIASEGRSQLLCARGNLGHNWNGALYEAGTVERPDISVTRVRYDDASESFFITIAGLIYVCKEHRVEPSMSWGKDDFAVVINNQDRNFVKS